MVSAFSWYPFPCHWALSPKRQWHGKDHWFSHPRQISFCGRPAKAAAISPLFETSVNWEGGRLGIWSMTSTTVQEEISTTAVPEELYPPPKDPVSVSDNEQERGVSRLSYGCEVGTYHRPKTASTNFVRRRKITFSKNTKQACAVKKLQIFSGHFSSEVSFSPTFFNFWNAFRFTRKNSWRVSSQVFLTPGVFSLSSTASQR